MRYYIRASDSTPVDGPLTVEEINARIQTGEIGPSWLATGDIGESRAAVLKLQPADWAWVGQIPGVSGVTIPVEPRPTLRNGDVLLRKLALFLVIAVLLVLVPLLLLLFYASAFRGMH